MARPGLMRTAHGRRLLLLRLYGAEWLPERLCLSRAAWLCLRSCSVDEKRKVVTAWCTGAREVFGRMSIVTDVRDMEHQ